MSEDDVGRFVFQLALVVAVFVVLRALLLWYWKVNEIVALLTSINTRLGKLATLQVASEPPAQIPDEMRARPDPAERFLRP
jgi:hypothetical protein